MSGNCEIARKHGELQRAERWQRGWCVGATLQETSKEQNYKLQIIGDGLN